MHYSITDSGHDEAHILILSAPTLIIQGNCKDHTATNHPTTSEHKNGNSGHILAVFNPIKISGLRNGGHRHWWRPNPGDGIITGRVLMNVGGWWRRWLRWY